MSENLRGFRYNKALESNPSGTPLLLFSRGDEVRLVAWRPDTAAEGATASVAASDGTFRHGVLGADPRPDVQAENGRLPLPTADTVSVFLPRASNKTLSRAAASLPSARAWRRPAR